MKKEKVKVAKEKYYGFSLPNKHEENIVWMGYDDLTNYIKEKNLNIFILDEWTRKDLITTIIKKTAVQDITVCLILDDKGNWARGVTVFNRDEDVYNEKIGKIQARQYALRALKNRKIDKNEFERIPAVETLVRTKCPFTKKGQKNINLTMYERSLLFGKNFQEKYKQANMIKKRKFNFVGIVDKAFKDNYVNFTYCVRSS